MTTHALLRRILTVATLVTTVAAAAAATTGLRDPDRKITVVALQAGTEHYKNGNPGLDANFQCLADQARAAAKIRPDLIVFPEYAITGWRYPDEATMNSVAEPVPGHGPWYRRYQALAREVNTPLVCWIVESDAGRLYNCAFILDGRGEFVGKYEKVNANFGEQTWWGWSQGSSLVPIELNGVRYGINICADMESPEPVRASELLGADVIIHQSISDDMQRMVPVRASDSKLPIVMSIFRGGVYAVDDHGELIGRLAPEKPGWKAFELQPFKPHFTNYYGGVYEYKLGAENLRNLEATRVLTDPASRPTWTSFFFDPQGRPQTRAQLAQRFKGRYDAADPELYHIPLVRFPAPWTSPYHVDPGHPYQFVNAEGEHLFLLNKTAWAYFGCKDPQGVLDRARRAGVNVLRVALEGITYPELGLDLWPWGGTRQKPDWSTFSAEYWDRVEQRVRLAGEHGIGLDITFYFNLKPTANEVARQRPYWEEALRRLSKYSNVLIWEVANEYVENEAFQDQAGPFLKEHDPYHRPVCTSDNTTDDAVWPDKPWVGIALNHTCTSSTERHDLRDWYLAAARNTRSHGKPAFANETGREKRHHNDDGVNRRKQAWLWSAAGAFWTLHSWGGCEGIDDPDYRAPGEEFMLPMTRVFRAQPFWRMDPNFSVCEPADPALIHATLSTPDHRTSLAYMCVRATGQSVSGATANMRLPDGRFRLIFLRPADGTVLETRSLVSSGFQGRTTIQLPAFTDDLAVVIEAIETGARSEMPGSQ